MRKLINNKNLFVFILFLSGTLLLTFFSNALRTFNSKEYSKPNYQTCFTPGQNCTQLIVDYINNAKQSVYVQAYSFTSDPIAVALVDAKRRGLDVKVILDRSQIPRRGYSSSQYFLKNGIETFIDYRPAIAHNKVMILDNHILITGSFNFTKAAQKRNAENLLVVKDSALAQIYLDNWLTRKGRSILAKNYISNKKQWSTADYRMG